MFGSGKHSSFLGKCVGLWHPLAVVDEPALFGEYETGPVVYECGHGVTLTCWQKGYSKCIIYWPKDATSAPISKEFLHAAKKLECLDLWNTFFLAGVYY